MAKILDGDHISAGKLEYFRVRLQSCLHQLVLAEFVRQKKQGLDQIELARRIGRTPEIIDQLLGAPGGWTLNDVSDLLLGMGTVPNVVSMNQVDSDVPFGTSALAACCWGLFWGSVNSVPWHSLSWDIVVREAAISLAVYWITRGLGRINRYRKHHRAC